MDSDGRSGGFAMHEGQLFTANARMLGSGVTASLPRAARIALWLSREYALVFGNDAVASGWLARAERLLRDVAPGAEQGWLSLARSERTRDPNESAHLAEEALAVAETAGDTDLELRALAQLGLAEVSVGPRGRRPRAARRGDGGGDGRRAYEPGDVRRCLLHTHAGVRPRR